MLDEAKRAYLKSIYFDPKNPAAFSGLLKVWKIIRSDKKVTKAELKDWLLEQDTYTAYHPVNRKIKRPRTISPGVDAIWGSDVAYMIQFQEHNDGVGYFVVFIDLFSRYAWAYTLKTLRGVEMVKTIKSLFEEEQCKAFFTDSGSEYKNKLVETYLKSQQVKHYTSKNEKKVAHAERLIKQLKRKLIQYMNETNTYKWTSVLDDFVKAYNNSYHRIIKMTPSQARQADQYTVWSNQYFTKPKNASPPRPKKPKNKQPFKFKEGDRVKLLAEKKPFDREYDEKYTAEVFTITDRRISDSIPTYTIKDEQNDPIIGWFYGKELLKVNVPEDKAYKIETVLRKRKRNGQNEIFVKFRGYPKKFNAWVSDVDYL